MESNLQNQLNSSLHLASVANSTITIEYTSKSDDALFDVCDLSGSILISGKLSETTKIDITGLPSGVYVFYIIDCGKVYKERIQV